MQVQSLGHVVLKVRDLERSAAFYAGVLGLTEVGRIDGQMVFYSIAGNHHDLALMAVGKDAAPAPDRAPGLAHVALKVGDSLDELRAAKTWLESQGVGDLRLRDHEVSRSIYFKDPDGNEIEVFVDGDPKSWRDNPALVATSRPLAL